MTTAESLRALRRCKYEESAEFAAKLQALQQRVEKAVLKAAVFKDNAAVNVTRFELGLSLVSSDSENLVCRALLFLAQLELAFPDVHLCLISPSDDDTITLNLDWSFEGSRRRWKAEAVRAPHRP